MPLASSTSSASAQTSPAHIVLTPSTASVASGDRLQLTALIENSGNTGVRWSASAGTISTDGLFSAPAVTNAETVEVQAETLDHLAPIATAPASILVNPTEGLIIPTQDLPPAMSGEAYSSTLISGRGIAPYLWAITA